MGTCYAQWLPLNLLDKHKPMLDDIKKTLRAAADKLRANIVSISVQ